MINGISRRHAASAAPAEAAAGRGLDHVHALVAEHRSQCLLDVEGTLHGADQRQPTVLARHRDHALRLDVELLLVPDGVEALDDGAALGLLALVDADALEDVVLAEDLDRVVLRGLRIEQRGQGLHVDRDVPNGIEGPIPRGRSDQRDGFLDVAGDSIG